MISLQRIVEEKIIPEGFVVRYRYLSSLLNNPLSLKRKLEEIEDRSKWPDYLIEGYLIDSLLTETQEETDAKFKLLVAPVPTEKTKLLVDRVTELYPEPTKEQVIQVARDIEFGASNWKEDTIYNKYLEWQPYILEKQSVGDKIPVDVQTMVSCRSLVEAAKEDEIVGQYLNENNLIRKPLIKYTLNVSTKAVTGFIPLNFESEIDLLWVDRDKKLIRVLELKSYSGSFKYNYYNFGYWLQGTLYTTALIKWTTEESNEFFGYTILPTLFIALNKNGYDIPRLYEMHESHLSIATWGGFLDPYKEPVTGWMDLSLDFLWHKVNNAWNYTRRVYEHNCIEVL